jgi:hypothetical protein
LNNILMTYYQVEMVVSIPRIDSSIMYVKCLRNLMRTRT